MGSGSRSDVVDPAYARSSAPRGRWLRIAVGVFAAATSLLILYDMFAGPRARIWEETRQWFSFGSKRGLLDDGGGLYMLWALATSVYAIASLATASSAVTRGRQVGRVILGVALLGVVAFVIVAMLGAQGSR